jgi:hypothetical protein
MAEKKEGITWGLIALFFGFIAMLLRTIFGLSTTYLVYGKDIYNYFLMLIPWLLSILLYTMGYGKNTKEKQQTLTIIVLMLFVFLLFCLWRIQIWQYKFFGQ